MSLLQWQKRFEQYLQEHWCHDDSAHDIAHLQRVWKTAQHLMSNTNANGLVVIAACYFHDIVNLPKDSPNRKQASSLAAEEAIRILGTFFPDFPDEYYADVAHAVRAHSFSAGIVPETLEAKIVQDADRLESLGAIGLARVFYVSGALGRPLFDSADPLAENRALDDSLYALDHFQNKLLKLPATMQTEAGKSLAEYNAHYLVQFMAKLCAELSGDYLSTDEKVLQRFS
ncbi:phosphohydrolase [Citrobacter sp. JGM124]|uniref:phosphohydrolase n=1 Tax=Citrobacter sp. JGM124 TaxID=2799789 RepID=UPI001BA85BFE|nr:phosphohydrolase [Citrobacter sp. JGM124]MBS0846938.1 phosphohydrolase [Citrobacter sp. JGM124]